MAKKKKEVKKSSDDSKLFAFLATFLSIIGFILALLVKREDKYVIYYAKQSLVIFIASIVVWVATIIFVFIPIIGWIIIAALRVLIAVLWVFSWIYALSGKTKPTPLIGQYGEKIKL